MPPLASDQWIGDMTAVTELADDRTGITPRAEHAAGAAVPDAVGRHLVRRGDEAVLAFFIQAGLNGVIRHHAAHHGKVGRRECEGLMDGGRRRKRHAERYDRSAEATKGVTLSPVITFRDQRMTATRLFDDAGVERRGVIR